MVIIFKMGQFCKFKELKEKYDRNAKKNFDETFFRAVLTLAPSAYKTELINNEVYVNIIDVSISEGVLLNKLEDLKEEKLVMKRNI
jgi:hypothetical protein